MEPQSPPKRMTRARAAAKAGDNEAGPMTARITTAAARAKVAPAATRATASTKRKTRSDESDQENGEHNEPTTEVVRTTRPRGRPKKMVEESVDKAPPAITDSGPGRATRARAAVRKAASDVPKQQEPAPVDPAKPKRGRPRKTPVAEDAKTDASEPPKVPTRTRAGTLTTTKPVTKKKVTFEEPEKENVNPSVEKQNGESKQAGPGLRGRPVRKPSVPKATRTATKASTAPARASKIPLSPKKVTQMPVCRDMSEDELTAVDEVPVRALKKNPVKPPTAALAISKKPTLASKEADPVPEMQVEDDKDRITFGSPARRPPTSPFRDSMKSPAKRIEGITLLKPATTTKTASDNQTSPFKASLLSSPAKRPQSPIKSLALPLAGRGASDGTHSPMKASLLQSPAKRPLLPFKSAAAASQPTQEESVPLQLQPLEVNHVSIAAEAPILPQGSPSLQGKSLSPSRRTPSQKLMAEEQDEHFVDQIADTLDLAEPFEFPGRLSAVLPRYADPALKDDVAILYGNSQNETTLPDAQPVVDVPQNTNQVAEGQEDVDEDGDSLMSDESTVETPCDEQVECPVETKLGELPSKPQTAAFSLRQKDVDPCHDMDSDSDDDFADDDQRGARRDTSELAPITPSSRSRLILPSTDAVGFTPLVQQLSTWAASSPTKTSQAPSSRLSISEESMIKSSYFEDEMTVRVETEVREAETAAEFDPATDLVDVDFDDVVVTEEDLELAAEADEMSVLEPEQAEDIAHDQSYDDSLSEVSQEYGDENEMPIDPAMLGGNALVPPKTPSRVLTREFHTVSKVPLKGADEGMLQVPKKKRSASISRLPPSRPTAGLTRSATVISYSPMKKSNSSPRALFDDDIESQTSAPVTPTKSETWSAAGTPARTPRRDLNSSLLSGAVVFVDVHTSDGADASGLFVELLTQMGARCVKTWSWNPDGAAGTDSTRIGITHVVYKDGDKHTLEKVRDAQGVVQCVGVSWVLDCERENEWLDEAMYHVDTAAAPRAGARRRKSMDPSALASLNGLGVPSTNSARDSQTAPNTPMNRRDSTAWMHTPSDQADDEDDEQAWQSLLTPVPKTPAPEALARYAADMTPETPTAVLDFDSPSRVLMQTCPPKPNMYSDLGHGILDRQKDEGVLMRLMAARRKSLQFAPKVGSPLAKAWK